jgi:threonine synthase
MQSALTHLECTDCGTSQPADRLQTVCPRCGAPLAARYDLGRAATTLSRDSLESRPRGIWKWLELLPVVQASHRFSLGEGSTPLVHADRLGPAVRMHQLWIKDESGNPTGSFKARGLAVAVSKAVELGATELVIPTAGNAGGALAAYAARAGIHAHVYMPRDAPQANQEEVQAFGAELVLVDGLIGDAGKQAAADGARHGWFDVSTFKEPYRLEGKKTMGFELAEHFGRELPDVILYPTGGGTGLVGMWKAFQELGDMGWLDAQRPRMISVQASGCAPVVQAFHAGAERITPWQGAQTIASGLRVPSPFADRLILHVLHESAGTAVAVDDQQILDAQRELASSEGVLASPEGAAAWAAVRVLLSDGRLKAAERVVLFNTGSGLKYL